MGVPFCIPTINASSCWSTSSSAFGGGNVVDFGHFSKCVVVSHWHFHWYLPYDIWGLLWWLSWLRIHLQCGRSGFDDVKRFFTHLFAHLHIFFGEGSVKVLGSFYNWVRSCLSVCVCVCVLQLYQSCFSCIRLLATLWAVACQAPLSMGFSRQE